MSRRLGRSPPTCANSWQTLFEQTMDRGQLAAHLSEFFPEGVNLVVPTDRVLSVALFADDLAEVDARPLSQILERSPPGKRLCVLEALVLTVRQAGLAIDVELRSLAPPLA